MKYHCIAAVLLFISVFMLFSLPCGAESSGAFDTDKLYEALPDETRELLDEKGITPEDGTGSIGLEDIWNSITSIISEQADKPLKMFGAVTSVILLASVISSVSDAAGSGSQIYTLVTTASCAVVIAAYMSEILETARAAFSGASDFMLAYIPVLAGVTAAGGHSGSAAVFNSVTLTAIQVLSRLISSAVIPLTSCIIGITAAGSIDPGLKLDRLGEGIKKLVVWGLGLIMTLFLGILSLQTIITASADNAAMKTLKFAVSSAVPIVGGAVSDALSTVSGSLSMLRSGIGGFGIAAGAFMLLPAVLTALCYKFLLFAAGIISDLFGCDAAGRIIRSGENAMTTILASLACVFLFITVSSAILLASCRS